MQFILTFLAVQSMWGLIIRLSIILTIAMALYKGYEAVIGVFS